MLYIVAFPASTENIVVLRLSLDQIYKDAIIGTHVETISNLRVGESCIIRNRYLIVRIA